MENLLIGLFIIVALGVCFPLGQAQAQPSEDYLAASLDLIVGQALQAYNSEDYFKFFEYFAKEMSPITTKQYFKAVYTNGHKRNLGEFYRRDLILKQSSLDPDYPMLVYEGQFEKYDQVLIVVNFTKEYDNYRIERIRFDKIFPKQVISQ